MRVIAGASRGRRLVAPLPATVRPTSDRVRESIFDILGSMGGVVGLSVADLFCGSGALGIEALSRGAETVTFVDHDQWITKAVATNLEAVGLGDASATVVRASLPGWLRGQGPFDLALCDPPYDFTDWSSLLSTLDAPLAMAETSASAPEIVAPEGWAVAKSRRYGGTLVTVLRRTDSAAS
jgi:16S rRNA (guanine966-N2)-methyltransferase